MRDNAGAWPVIILLCLSLLITASTSFGQAEEIMKFEQGDTLEQLRHKVDHNGYGFTVEHNWVYDMPVEMKESFFSRHPPLVTKHQDVSGDMGPLANLLGKKLPAQFDWRSHNGHSYIGPVRDQGACGSCYAFSACAAAEGTYNRVMGRYDDSCADFSESFMIWCLGRLPWYYPHFFGCDGADYDYYELQALTELGICDEDDFPYIPHNPGLFCAHWKDQRTLFKAWHRIPCNDIDAIKTAIMTYGVVDAAVDVIGAFEAYGSGIYEDSATTCDSSPCYYTPTNHAIALVGWNDNGDPYNEGYWILRNSWGESWGEGGYMRIKYKAARVACEVCYLVSIGDNCGDYNSDGLVDQDDLNEKVSDTVEALTAWGRTCFKPKEPCGDYNGDGTINSIDALQKFNNAVQGVMTWVQECWLSVTPDSKSPETPHLDALEKAAKKLEVPPMAAD